MGTPILYITREVSQIGKVTTIGNSIFDLTREVLQ